MKKAFLLMVMWSVCSYAHQTEDPTITLKLEDKQLKQLCEILIIQAYISGKVSSQFAEKQAKEIVERVLQSK